MEQLLIIDPETFVQHYPARPFVVRHNLVGNPLFEVPRLLQLLPILAENKVNYYTGKVGVNDDKEKAPPTGLTAEETIRKIREAESWLVLKNTEKDPEYRRLLDDCLAAVTPLAEPLTPGLRQSEAWVFVTSPKSVTPYHLDPEHNFLLQIQGQKTVHVFNPADRDLLTEEELERYFVKGSAFAKLEFTERFQAKAFTATLNPGDGIFIPVNAPHWLSVHDEVSISFSITYYSDEVYRRARLYRFNAMLRRLGLKPTPYGKSPSRDAAKDIVVSTVLKARKLFGRSGEA
jgi:ribosomal protein L16 Arg81 hydroxylase